MKIIRNLRLSLLSLICSYTLTIAPSYAGTLDAEGVAGDMDAKSRNPHLTVSTSVESNQTVILADAFHPSNDFKKYPIQFDFFVNRNLFATQYRSPTLDGPIGVTVPKSTATPPFNYVVVAKILHPNSVYTTVIEGAVFENELGATVDCTLTLASEEDDATIYTASNVVLTQASDSTVATSFTAESQDGDTTISVSAQISTEAEGASSFTVTKDGESAESISGTATSESDDAGVSSFVVTSNGGDSTLSCSR